MFYKSQQYLTYLEVKLKKKIIQQDLDLSEDWALFDKVPFFYISLKNVKKANNWKLFGQNMRAFGYIVLKENYVWKS